jgi:hypothetical protein
LLEKDFRCPIDIVTGNEVKNLKIHTLYRDTPMDYIQGKARIGRLDPVAFGHLIINDGHLGLTSGIADEIEDQ